MTPSPHQQGRAFRFSGAFPGCVGDNAPSRTHRTSRRYPASVERRLRKLVIDKLLKKSCPAAELNGPCAIAGGAETRSQGNPLGLRPGTARSLFLIGWRASRHPSSVLMGARAVDCVRHRYVEVIEGGKILKLPNSRLARDTDSWTDGIKPTFSGEFRCFSSNNLTRSAECNSTRPTRLMNGPLSADPLDFLAYFRRLRAAFRVTASRWLMSFRRTQGADTKGKGRGAPGFERE